MNSFLELAKNRYSCRKYLDKPIEKEKLDYVLEAGRVAPSAVNFQPWKFIVVQEKDNLKKVHEIYHREWINSSPCVIIVCGDKSKSWKRKEDNKDHLDIDIAITVDHITLAATAQGLATCWVCNFYVENCKKVLNLPDSVEPIVILPIGYPADNADATRHGTKRKSIEEIVQWEF